MTSIAPRVEEFRVRIGSIYRFSPGVPQKLCPAADCRYRVLGVALHAHTGQEQVVYEGLDGPDRGKWFCAPPFDFAIKFTPEKEPRP